jgi:hypothetical protein
MAPASMMSLVQRCSEVPVQRRGRDARALDHLVDPNCLDAASREQLVGGIQNPLAGAEPGLGRFLAGLEHPQTLALERAFSL